MVSGVPQYTVTSALDSKRGDVVIEALIGEYVEVSKNHGKLVYQKAQEIPGHRNVKVLLYYWDKRDGVDVSGWWFGDSVGGTQVWAHNGSHSPTPPLAGWKIPWNAERAEPGILLVNPCKAGKGQSPQSHKGQSLQGQKVQSPQGQATAGGLGLLTPRILAKGVKTDAFTAPSGEDEASAGKGRNQESGEKGKGRSSKGKGHGKNAESRHDRSSWNGHGDSSNDRSSWNRNREDTPRKKTFVPQNLVERKAHEALEKARGLSARSVEATIKYVKNMVVQQLANLDRQLKNPSDMDESRLQDLQASLNLQLRKIESNFTENTPELEEPPVWQAPQTKRPPKPKKKVETPKDELEEEEPEEPPEPAVEKTEEEHTHDFEEGMVDAKEAAVAAEDNVEAVCIMGKPMLSRSPEELGDDTATLLGDIENAHSDSQTIVNEARQMINARLKASRVYPEELRKKAEAELSSLLENVKEAQAKLNPFKNFKQGFQAKVDAKKAVSELDKKIEKAELQVEKAVMMSASAEQQKMSDVELKYAEELINPAQAELSAVSKLVDGKIKGANAAVREELDQMRIRLAASSQKLGQVIVTLKQQRDKTVLDKLFKDANEKLDKTEVALEKCHAAEEPLLNGVKDLDVEVANKALSESEAAAVTASRMVEQTMGFIRTKIAEAKGYNKEVSKPIIDNLIALQERVVTAGKGVTSFKNSTLERKVALVMSDVVDAVLSVEEKAKELAETAAIFSFETIQFDELTTADVDSAGEKYAAIETQVISALAAARKALLAKQKDIKGEDLAKGFQNVNGRLNVVQQDLTKAKKAKSTCDQLMKGKKLLEEQEQKLKAAESEVDKAEAMASGDTCSDEDLKEIDASMNNASAAFKACQVAVQNNMNTSLPATKLSLQKLLERCKVGFGKFDKIRQATKGQRENMMIEDYLQKGESMASKVEEAMEKANEAELPFLSGVEALQLKETLTSLKAADDASAAVDAEVLEARKFLAARNIEIKSFKSEKGKEALSKFTKLAERITVQAGKLTQLRKDTEMRKMAAKVQEAGEKITSLEGNVQELGELLKPLSEEEPKEGQWDSILALEKEAHTKASEARSFLVARSKEKDATQAERFEVINKLHARLGVAQAELTKVRKSIAVHEQKSKGKVILDDARNELNEVEAEVKTLTDFCAPLLQDSGESFLIESRLTLVMDILKEHMQEHNLSHRDIFDQVTGGKETNITKEAFMAFLTQLPAKVKREECELSTERQVAIFERINADGDGEISLPQFTEAFRKRYTCIHSIVLTDVFDIKSSKPITKLEVSDIVESTSGPKKETPEGVPRIHCKLASDDKEGEGWVTMHGNAGTTYLEELPKYKEFCESVSEKLQKSQGSAGKTLTMISNKTKELSALGNSVPVADMKAELSKLLEQATAACTSVSGLQKSFAEAQKAFSVRERAEANAYVEARDQKHADEILEVCRPAVETLEQDVQKLKLVAEPLTSISGDELLSFTTPVTLQDHFQELMEPIAKGAAETLTLVLKQQDKVKKAANGPLMDARRQLIMLNSRTSVAKGLCESLSKALQLACGSIAEKRLPQAVTAVREHMREKGLSSEDLWSKLATPGEEHITEAAFCEYLIALESVKFNMEHAQLATRKIERGGVGRRTFQGLLQQYFMVVKEIAITESFHLNVKEKPLRKAEMEEVFDVLEGPRTDDKTLLQRVRARSMNDGVIGWITLKGNDIGTEFLQEVEKPYFVCVDEVAFQVDFRSGSEVLRPLKVEEVLEFIEGPRKEVFESALRMKCKATADGKVGWVTVKDRHGTELAVKTDNHYTCTSTVAMTSDFDVKGNDVKAIKKLALDEVFTVLEGPLSDDTSAITRVKGRSTLDGTEGWITIKGNAGTVYAKAKKKCYTVTADELPLQKGFTSEGAKTLRTLVKDEVLDCLEGPKEESFEPVTRVKCRASGDGAVGWLTVEAGGITSWSGSYNVLRATPMHEARDTDSDLVRQLPPGENLDLLEGPMEIDGVMRMKCRVKSDSTTGWLSFRDAEGNEMVQSS